MQQTRKNGGRLLVALGAMYLLAVVRLGQRRSKIKKRQLLPARWE